MAQVEGYGSIRHANSISIPAFGRVRGMPVMGGSPLEIYATIASVQAARKALWKCGRPGLPILNLISSATTSMATIAGSHPAFGLRPSDGWLIDFRRDEGELRRSTGWPLSSSRAATLLGAVASGAPSVQTTHPAKATKVDGITPMEARFGVDMAIVAARFNRQQASELVKQLLDKYESQIESAPSGSRYQECYDVTTGRPAPSCRARSCQGHGLDRRNV